MSAFNYNGKNNCSVVAFVASIIVGVIAAFLRITAVITLSDAFLWVLFGIAVFYLAVLLVISGLRNCSVCPDITLLLTGILGTVLLSVILLGIEFAATSIAGAVAVGLLLFFFSLTVSSAACVIRCFSGCDNH